VCSFPTSEWVPRAVSVAVLMCSILPGSADCGGDAYTREAYVEDAKDVRPCHPVSGCERPRCSTNSGDREFVDDAREQPPESLDARDADALVG
jgi:hypothetical protein